LGLSTPQTGRFSTGKSQFSLDSARVTNIKACCVTKMIPHGNSGFRASYIITPDIMFSAERGFRYGTRRCSFRALSQARRHAPPSTNAVSAGRKQRLPSESIHPNHHHTLEETPLPRASFFNFYQHRPGCEKTLEVCPRGLVFFRGISQRACSCENGLMSGI
jgi:hypothetical protein